ncbi:MAG: hypothetical protein M3065_01180 [Actinomycetota bacterium]|nr:hypothetical protein [Actinomycetota bacterium]
MSRPRQVNLSDGRQVIIYCEEHGISIEASSEHSDLSPGEGVPGRALARQLGN